ncbi:MAG: hypothetical protein R3227_14500 [Reinekea sp.]|nr:hypothetical protein [Reinekea sp.]
MRLSVCLGLMLVGIHCQPVWANDNFADLFASISQADPDGETCFRLPGLVLEMGSDKPLDNFPVCFTSVEATHPMLITADLPRAHHYLNEVHSLVNAPVVCDQGSGQVRKWLLGPLALPKNTDWYVGIERDCGREGCAYGLSYMSSEPLNWCHD